VRALHHRHPITWGSFSYNKGTKKGTNATSSCERALDKRHSGC